MSTSKTIVLKSSDGETFEVEEAVAVAVESQTIKDAIEFTRADTSILLPNVTSKILAKVIEYCKRHVDAPKSDDKYPEDDLKKFDEEFVKVDQGTLFDLILAANYLNIKSLLHLTSQTVTDMIKGKTTEEIRKTFNIKNDFTPEEEERMTGKKRSFARRMTSLLRKKRSFAGIMTSLLRKKRRFAGRMTSLLRRMQHQERGGSHA